GSSRAARSSLGSGRFSARWRADFEIAHNSLPFMWSLAVKKTRGPTGVKKRGEDQPAPTARSCTTRVVLVPLVAHSSRPWASSYALNSARPPTFLKEEPSKIGPNELAGPGLMSKRRSAVTPSLLHSSHPLPSLAANTRASLT